jgi:ankyrin repeat protein
MLNPRLDRHPVTRFALLSLVLVGLGITACLSAASIATPTESTKPAEVSQALAELIAPGTVVAPQLPQRLAFGGPGQVRRGASAALNNALFEAAEDGDVSQIDDLLRSGADVNAVIRGDGTPLIAAARKGHFEAVRYLLDRGAGPNLPAPGDGNPSIVAAANGHFDVVRLLLDRGADPNAAVIGDGNPLIAAANRGHADIVTLLLDRGARIDEVVPGDENALIQASAAGRLDIVRLLVNRRADVNVRVWVDEVPGRTAEWRTALNVARRWGHEDVVQFLLSVGARD